MINSVHQFSAENYKGEQVNLADYKGKVLLIVNTASACGLTPQYEGLQAIYDKYHDDGFEILAFPCNQFKEQEKGTNEEIKSFCDLQFNIKFPLFSKLDVNGDNAHPLYKFLKSQAPGIFGTEKIKWNFTKFLINKDGEVVSRYAPITKPSAITRDIENEL
ncbi:glutathione peroxidase [Thalassotalea atypica]|uniref:glutathione peroxidase n=1 Tax=Thalassotalea atypica TaxID=2054316 RepID=UPI002573DDA9|nr:glutathione peroxidase [Thalassotalea atypica]